MLRKNVTLKFANYIVVWDNLTTTGISENNEISWTLIACTDTTVSHENNFNGKYLLKNGKVPLSFIEF